MADDTELQAVAAVLHAKKRQANRWTVAAETRFFETLAASANVSYAALQAGMTKKSAYNRKHREPAFARAWMRALDEGISELEWLLLKHATEGSERTETVRDGACGAVKQIRTVHSYSHGFGLRLLQMHRQEVDRYRRLEAERGSTDEDIGRRVRAEMALIRARIAEQQDGGTG